MSLKYVSLHNHTSYSIYDAIGSVEDYAEWNIKNAGDSSMAFCCSDHGNSSAVGSIAALQKKYKTKGVPFKLIYGMEGYYLPSLKNWNELKAQREIQKKEEKEQKKKRKIKQENEEEDGLVVEDEAESKSSYTLDPFYRRNHLVVLAQNQIGLTNLFRLVTRSYRKGMYKKPRIDLEMLKELNEGLVLSSACVGGIAGMCSMQHPDNQEEALKLYDKELKPLMDIFGKERFYLELQFNKLPQQQILNKHLIEYSKRTGYKLIATCDSHYPQPQMFKDRAIYKLLGYQMLKEDVDMSILEQKVEDLDCHLYLKNGDQMFKAYKDTFGKEFNDDQLIKEAIERTYDIAHHFIEQVEPDNKIKFPKIFQPTETVKTPFDQLKLYCIEALKKKKLHKQEYIDRAVYELKIIKQLGAEEYFLTMKRILDIVCQHMLVGVGRGSGAGSLVNYLLDITMVDPVKHGLLFERFMSPSRKELPDIDNDIELKEESWDILKNHFGQDNVVAISNYNRLQLKSLVKDISKLYDIEFDEVNKVTLVMEKEARDKIMAEIGHDQKLYEFTFEKALEYSPTFQEFMKKYPHVGESISNLYQEIRAIGRHAGGVVVAPDMEQHIPIIRIRGTDQSPVVEGLTAQHLKYVGLVKYDILGLVTLRIIRRCIEIILTNQGVKNPSIRDVWEFYNKHLHPDIICSDDPKVFDKVYCKGSFPSIFQFAERGVQQFCVSSQPKNVKDISVITSTFRPGPLKNRAHEKYLYYDEQEVKKDHPIIREVLGESRNLIVYQEQFMLLAHKMAGFSLEEADTLRKLLVKPSHELGEEMKKQRAEAGERFIKGCIEKGMESERAKDLWEKEIMGFISYGFARAHAVSYAYNSLQCAWLYTYYEKEWIKACLECDPEQEKTINVTRGLGYTIDKVDVNRSSATSWTLKDKCWLPPLTSLKGIGLTASNELVNHRPAEGFKDFHDFLFDEYGFYRWSKFNKKSIDILIKAESFESLGCIGHNKLFKNYKHMYTFIDENFEHIKKGKVKLEQASEVEVSDWTTVEKIALQRELTGFYDKNLIVGRFLPTFEEFEIQAIDEFGYDNEDGPKIKVWAVVEDVEQKTTKNGKPYLSVTVSGISDKPYRFKIWNTKYEEGGIWNVSNVVVFSLDWDRQFSYSLSRNMKPMKISK